MKNTNKKKNNRHDLTIHYYIDESGSPDFYGKRNKLLVGKQGYSPVLIIGLVTIVNRDILYSRIERFKTNLKKKTKLSDIYSLHQPEWYLHAKDDHPEVRVRFFKFLTKQDFRGYFIIGRKDIGIFHKRHKSSEKNFYFDLVENLLKDRLKDFKEYNIYLSRRSGDSINAFTEAINHSIDRYNKSTKRKDIKPKYTCTIVPGKSSPELSIADYMLWALQRYILKKDKTYFDLLKDKYFYIYDLYDKRTKMNKFYDHKNPFDLDKAGKFK